MVAHGLTNPRRCQAAVEEREEKKQVVYSMSTYPTEETCGFNNNNKNIGLNKK
jgi:hypothetical protein